MGILQDGRVIIGNDWSTEQKRRRSLVDLDGLRLWEGWRKTGGGRAGDGVVAVAAGEQELVLLALNGGGGGRFGDGCDCGCGAAMYAI